MNDDIFIESSPEKQGIPSKAITGFLQEIKAQHIQLDGIIIMRNNAIVTEGYFAPFSKDKRHRLFSAGKAVVALAILFAIQEKLLNLSDKLIDLLPDNLPDEISDNLRKVTLYHLLTMTAGHAIDSFGLMLEDNLNRERIFLKTPFVYTPGTHFLYDNGIPDILALILYRVTKQSVLKYLKPRLFEPLNIVQMCAEKNGELDELPSMCCTTREFFKLALFLDKGGKWNNVQILEKRLVDAVGAYHTPSLQCPSHYATAHDTKFGYGFQVWRNSIGGYRIDGGRGQFGIVLPDVSMVIALQASEEDQDIILRTLWQFVTNNLSLNALDENAQDYLMLQDCLLKLTWAPDIIKTNTLSFSGKYTLDKTCLGCDSIEIMQNNTHLSFTINGNISTSFCVDTNIGWQCALAPFEFFAQSNNTCRLDKVYGYDPKRVYISGNIICEHTFELYFRSDAWMNGFVLTFTFVDDRLCISLETTMGRSLRLRSPWLCHDALKTQQKYMVKYFNGIKTSV